MAEGITPAHAGKTLSCTRWGEISWDHPRACGENECTQTKHFLHRGSPPRMRGKPPPVTPYRAGDGITPAHAGKTDQLD